MDISLGKSEEGDEENYIDPTEFLGAGLVVEDKNLFPKVKD